ncbi:MAG: bifunctional riboflavin kinase/FAD synthetase [Prolixibacteraceae bacterium]|nr:bifunctional riboflavin kinase/FAD synthetase [Prolixibacteraceae bacterium]
MKIYRDIENFNVANPVIAIGSFDGVHMGHEEIIRKVKEIAQKINGESVIFTFYPHPRQVLFPNDKNLKLITTIEEKEELFEKAGIENLIIYPFTKEFSGLNYKKFVKDILVKKLKIKALIVGYDHRFGKDREGGCEMLDNISKIYHFPVYKTSAVTIDNQNISSTRIREALEKGDIENTNRLLGYHFKLFGTVVEGYKRGRKINFPTANIKPLNQNKIIPGRGVYAVMVYANDKFYPGMLNIGFRPTVNHKNNIQNIEVYIIGFQGYLYNKNLKINFYKKIRDEQDFNSLENLQKQLEKDKKDITDFFNSNNFKN